MRHPVLAALVVLAGVGVVVGMVGCGGGGGAVTSPGNTTLGVVATGATVRPAGAVAPAGVAVPPLLVITLAGGGTVEIDQANVGVTGVDLETADEVNAEPDEQAGHDGAVQDGQAMEDAQNDFHGPYVADIVGERLLNPDGTPATDITTNFPPGTVLEEAEVDCDAVAGVCPVTPANAITVHLHGTYRDGSGAAVYNFHLDAIVQRELEFGDDTPGGITVGDNNLFSLVFAVDHWFDGVDLTTANVSPVDANGDVVFDGTNNGSLQSSIVNNMLQYADMGEDDNHDGEVDDDF